MLRVVFPVSSGHEEHAAACSAVRAAGLVSAAVLEARETGRCAEDSSDLSAAANASDVAIVILTDAGQRARSGSLLSSARAWASSVHRPLVEIPLRPGFEDELRDALIASGAEHACLIIEPGCDTSLLEAGMSVAFKAVLEDPRAGAVPYQGLFDVYFRHIQHEASWVNSRFMWCMFANSALLGFVATSGGHDVTWYVLAVGILVTTSTLFLQFVTFGAEQSAINQCDLVIKEWRRRVPQVRTFLYDTPAGGNSRVRHLAARWLMAFMLIAIVALWVILAIFAAFKALKFR
ncbi:MAG: hypothetical protein KatS3mg108_2554 [Isosphaeraceae bacterium]|nr:MAG: hypothetical protein KatS3mg108_2554 [Isosphaeraceae bacterium]